MAATPGAGADASDGDRRRRPAVHARPAGRCARPVGARALSRAPARSRRSAGGDGCVRDAVALGRAAAVAGAGDGRGPRGRRHRASPASPKSSTTAAPGCWCRRRPGGAWLGARNGGDRRRLPRAPRADARASVLPRFGVAGYVDAIVALYDRLLSEQPGAVMSGMREPRALGIVYHMPFWRDADGTLREVEGSFARYVDSLAPYFDEIVLCVPFLDRRARRRHGGAVHQRDAGAAAELRRTGALLPATAATRAAPVQLCSTGGCRALRVPTPAAIVAFVCSRLLQKPVFLLVVGDLAALRDRCRIEA